MLSESCLARCALSIDHRIWLLTSSLQDVVCTVNVQHDCIASGCNKTHDIPVVQERVQTSKTRSIARHEASRHFVLNVHSLHNYQHIKAVVPPHLRCRPEQEPDAFQIAQLRRVAASQVREMKKSRAKGNNQDGLESEDEGTNVAVALPAFQQNALTGKGKAKAKAKAKAKPVKTKGNVPSMTMDVDPGPSSAEPQAHNANCPQPHSPQRSPHIPSHLVPAHNAHPLAFHPQHFIPGQPSHQTPVPPSQRSTLGTTSFPSWHSPPPVVLSQAPLPRPQYLVPSVSSQQVHHSFPSMNAPSQFDSSRFIQYSPTTSNSGSLIQRTLLPAGNWPIVQHRLPHPAAALHSTSPSFPSASSLQFQSQNLYYRNFETTWRPAPAIPPPSAASQDVQCNARDHGTPVYRDVGHFGQ